IFGLLDEIQERGGTIKLIEEGWFQRRMAEFAYRGVLHKESGYRPLVGVNCYVEDEEAVDIEPFTHDPITEKKQIERLNRVRKERDEHQVQQLLDRLEAIARDDTQNLMPVTIELVEAGATMGDIVKRLKGLWGTYREVPVF